MWLVNCVALIDLWDKAIVCMSKQVHPELMALLLRAASGQARGEQERGSGPRQLIWG